MFAQDPSTKLILPDRLIDRMDNRGFKTSLSQDEFRSALIAAAESQMGTALISNPAGADGLSASFGSLTVNAINGDTVALIPGQLVEVVTPFAGSAPPGPYTGFGVPLNVKRSATTADFLLLGVVAGPTPTSSGTSANYPVGAVVEVVVLGITRIAMDANNSTAGHLILQSTATAGNGTDSATATNGKTIGTSLQTLTIGAANTLMWAHIAKF